MIQLIHLRLPRFREKKAGEELERLRDDGTIKPELEKECAAIPGEAEGVPLDSEVWGPNQSLLAKINQKLGRRKGGKGTGGGPGMEGGEQDGKGGEAGTNGAMLSPEGGRVSERSAASGRVRPSSRASSSHIVFQDAEEDFD